jgi:phosphoribosyl 1,2-cyclic phosphodiesterase
LRENIRRLDAVVFTHSHRIIVGFDDLRRYSRDLGSIRSIAAKRARLARV